MKSLLIPAVLSAAFTIATVPALAAVFGKDLPASEAELLANTQLPINHTALDEPATGEARNNKSC